MIVSENLIRIYQRNKLLSYYYDISINKMYRVAFYAKYTLVDEMQEKTNIQLDDVILTTDDVAKLKTMKPIIALYETIREYDNGLKPSMYKRLLYVIEREIFNKIL